MEQTVFIIDIYDKFFARLVSDQVRYRFLLNDNWYAIYEVPLEWGKPQMLRPVDEEQTPYFHYYESFDDAMAYVKKLKRINNGI